MCLRTGFSFFVATSIAFLILTAMFAALAVGVASGKLVNCPGCSESTTSATLGSNCTALCTHPRGRAAPRPAALIGCISLPVSCRASFVALFSLFPPLPDTFPTTARCLSFWTSRAFCIPVATRGVWTPRCCETSRPFPACASRFACRCRLLRCLLPAGKSSSPTAGFTRRQRGSCFDGA
uniref:Putative secreted protein n=1 Tax=Ixodes ricinus TaxID=34613 RepID=A0A6B0UZE6_IXORI